MTAPTADDSENEKLGDISHFITKGATPTTYGFRWESSGIRFLRSECVSEHGLDLRQSMFISEAANQSLRRSQVTDGDILITITGNVGRVVRLVRLDRANINQHIARIRIKSDRFDSGYVYHFLSQASVRQHFEKIVTGQAYPQISLKQVRDAQIMGPPVDAQRGIARALDDVDGFIRALERLVDKKEAIKQGLMQQLLTGGTRLPGFSEEWRRVKLGDVARFRKGSGLPKSDVSVGGSTPCVHYGELFTKYGPEIDAVEGRTNNTVLSARSEALDVLMPTSDVTPRGLAKASAIRQSGAILGGDILIIRPESTTLYGPFLAHVIRHDANQVLQLVRGSTVYHLYASDMRNFLLDVPAVEEQVAVTSALRDAGKEVETLRVRLEKARMLKIGIMQELLSGRARLPVNEGTK